MLKKVSVTIFLICLILIQVGSADPGEKVKAIMVLKDNPSSDDMDFLKNQGAAIKYKYNIIPGVALEMPSHALDRINDMCNNDKNPVTPSICERIESIELDRQVHATGNAFGKGGKTKPNPAQPPQTIPWGINRTNAEPAWATSTGAGVRIAVVDTGIDGNHPDLDENVKGCVNFVSVRNGCLDDNGHGTHVAGTIAAENNDIGVAGVAPDAWLYGVKVLDRWGSGWVSDLIAGIDWATTSEYGIQVITMSLGTSFDIQALHDALDNANSKGIVIVAAAGNAHPGGPISYPAKYDSVIAVTATDSNDIIAWFSNFGDEAELAAPGVGIYSTYTGGTYATLDGTSMAAPHVTGTVALLLTTQPEIIYDTDSDGLWDPSEVRNKLHDTAIDPGISGWDQYYGYGLVNAYNAVN